jgi:DNA sulfur modification protein DndD
MKLALYGSLALGDRVSQREYSNHLFDLLHRGAEDGSPTLQDEAGIQLAFDYIRSGEPLRIQVERKWERRGEDVEETLTVLENGTAVDVREDEYQDWLNDLVPPGLQALCFFDAEQLRDLADPDSHDDLLADTFYRLLGLNLVDRLEDDLQYLISQSSSSAKAKKLREEKEEKESVLEQLQDEHAELEEELDEISEEEDKLREQLAEQERKLRSEGGTYAERRPKLKERLSDIEPEMREAAEEFEALCEGLLPFALAPSLCRDLRDRLDNEEATQRQKIADEIWEERKQEVEERLANQSALDEVNEETKEALVQEVMETLDFEDEEVETADYKIIHHLTDEERQELRGWIQKALDVMPEKARVASERLGDLREEKQQIETELNRAPDEDYLAPIHERIQELEDELEELDAKREEVLEDKGTLSFRMEEKTREIEQLNAKLEEFSADKRSARRAMKSQRVLREYRRKLANKRASALEDAVVGAFNDLCRKERLLRDARIDEDFHVELETADGHLQDVGDLSAGERELYVLALLQALREISGRELPLVVDTPLARLDEVHRPRVLKDYFAGIAEQSVLLATSAELDEALLEEITPTISRAYQLSFDEEDGTSTVETTHTADRAAQQSAAALDQGVLAG